MCNLIFICIHLFHMTITHAFPLPYAFKSVRCWTETWNRSCEHRQFLSFCCF